MKLNKQILEAVQRGIKLALDDFEDDEVQNQESILSKKKILNYDAEEDMWLFENFVDLGLPSGTLWAKCNLGAKTPDDYGNYYAWGEIEPLKDNAYSAETYKFANLIDNDISIIKYGNGLNILSLEDDAAYLFDNRMCLPSNTQLNELVKYTTENWTTFHGIKGSLLTSKINGNSIFIPAAGIREDFDIDGINDYWNIWSREKWNDNLTLACVLYKIYYNHLLRPARGRWKGCSIRPVLNI